MMALYHSEQEALDNVVKHSKATHTDLKITFATSEMQIGVSDNSNGFVVPDCPTEFAPNGHIGLFGVHERADLIAVRLEIGSAWGK